MLNTCYGNNNNNKEYPDPGPKCLINGIITSNAVLNDLN